jgi:hypothetical protein
MKKKKYTNNTDSDRVMLFILTQIGRIKKMSNSISQITNKKKLMNDNYVLITWILVNTAITERDRIASINRSKYLKYKQKYFQLKNQLNI